MNSVGRWEDVSILISSSYRRHVLQLLDTPKTPTQLSRKLGINIAHISNTLSELIHSRMIESLTPRKRQGNYILLLGLVRSYLRKQRRL